MVRAHDFLATVHDRTLAALPETLRDHRFRIAYGMLQIHFGEPRIHYEVWLVQKTGRIEIGLHLEADRETNDGIAVELADLAPETIEALGPEAELEQWTASWTRLHVTLPLAPLDDALCRDVAARLSTLVQLIGRHVASLPAVPRAGRSRAVLEGGRYWRHRGRRSSAFGR